MFFAPIDWHNSCIIVPLHTCIGDQYKCINLNGFNISYLVGMLYGRMLHEMIRDSAIINSAKGGVAL